MYQAETLMCHQEGPYYTGQRLHQIPQVQGALMVMEGYAADNVTHCVMSNDIKVRGADFILHFVVE